MKFKRILPVLGLLLLLNGSFFAQYKNIRISKASSSDPEEVSIAINPVNPMNIAAGANINYYYFSKDGGLTWIEGRLSSALGVWGDPSVTFDPFGNLFFGHLSRPQSNGYWIDRIVVQKSVDGGATWSNGVGIGYRPPQKEQDKEWLICDHTNSVNRGNVYMSWTEFDDYGSSNKRDSSRILFSASDDQGLSWAEPITISDRCGDCIDDDNTVEGAVPAVGPDGEVYVSWSGPPGIMFDKSFDGGKTWGKDIFVNDQPGGWVFDIPGINRCNGLPVTVCDISNSKYRGNIYINWSDQRNGIENTDIFISKSPDGGTTWSAPIKVNDDKSNKNQFFTWASVDPITGVLYVVFYDRRNSTRFSDPLETDVYVAKSVDGGETFTNFKVSESSFIPNAVKFFGDYTNIAAYNGMVYPIWMRMDANKLSIWTAIINDNSTGCEQEEFELPEEFILLQNFPNPFNSDTIIKWQQPKAANTMLRIYDAVGNKITTLVNEFKQPGNHSCKLNTDDLKLASGIYFYQLIAGDYIETKKLILLR